jgi:type I restriction enzyme S subunit
MADYVNLRDQRRMRITLPPHLMQRRIASILSAYDDLIENNTRRIQILEEMAQAIYREWFAEFRFPGHEDVRMVDSELGPTPERWTMSLLKDVAEVNARSTRTDEELGEINYIDISSVSLGEFGRTPIQYQDAPGRARRLVMPYDVIWSTVRPNLRAYALVCEPPPNCIASTGFAVLSARTVPWSYLYTAVTADSFVAYLVNRATVSAYPAVTGRIFQEAVILAPDQTTLGAFHEAVGPMYRLAAKLRAMSSNLSATRDLLLPRLISGEIDVSNLDIGNAEPAA